jgi:nucleoporin p58/p45
MGTSSTLGQGSPQFTKSTRFNDLPDDVKRTLEQIDSHIQGRIQISKDLQQRKLGDEATKGNESIRALHKDLINTATIIRNDLHLTQDVKTKVDQAVEDTIVATRIIDGFRNPQSGNTYLKDHASFPLEYFTRVADQMKERLAWYKATIEQIERKLSSSATSAQTPQGISATLQVQHGTFLSLASKTAAVDAELQKIKAVYTQLWRSKTGSVRDPFNDNVKRSETPADFDLSSLTVR